MNKKTKKYFLDIAFSGVFIALLIVCQWGLAILTAKNQYVVGSAVNLVLIIAASVGGLIPGISVAIISPFLAYTIGVGPTFIQLIPFIALGNLALVIVWTLLCNKYKQGADMYIRLSASVVGAAVIKFCVLYLGIVKFAVPTLIEAPDAAKKNLSVMFSSIQLVTALIGGVLGFLLVPILKKAYNRLSR